MIQTTQTISDQELMKLSSQNPELRFERNADGTLVTMAPTGKISGNREAKAITYVYIRVQENDLGEVFSSSTGFKLPNGAVRSPDVAFVAKDRLPLGWDEGEDEFFNLAPDFVIEIRSKTDSLDVLKSKMEEYRENEVKLGWLLDRHNRQALVYRQDGSITIYPADAILKGEDVIPGFTLSLKILL
ncbi:unknown [Crocosphaera subtropica ATCC 51142]|uniref:Putative restriction endonuclease domain-containing protein n=1 Tax=Crocosphaera subtropica (strain ATCC 51142 / BH68) TaxID=43989 RepID=B1WZ34_CROS5|nr:Uma2 family endonuclease [Crocosphaera subtropica]ACB52798.1 unknown [Crocosphaera subtropica ATCC 51142]